MSWTWCQLAPSYLFIFSSGNLVAESQSGARQQCCRLAQQFVRRHSGPVVVLRDLDEKWTSGGEQRETGDRITGHFRFAQIEFHLAVAEQLQRVEHHAR